MSETAQTLLTLGCILLLGLAADTLGRRTKIPRVTLLLVLGLAVGPSGLSWLPSLADQWFPVAADMALVMVGFLLGGQLTKSSLREHGGAVLSVSLTAVFCTSAIVFSGLLLIGTPVVLSLILAGIAPATDPAAVLDVVHERRADGPFTRTLLGVVALDDAWGLILFSTLLAFATSLGQPTGTESIFLEGLREIGGGVGVGLAIGLPMAYITGRVAQGEPTLVEAIGLVFVCGGISMWLHVSFLISAMVMGATVANLAKHHTRPFHAIEGIEWPFMVLFFVLAGASLQVSQLMQIGGLGLGYVAFRVLGKLVGGWLGIVISTKNRLHGRLFGLAIMPQAGVAIGMVLIASTRLPSLTSTLYPIVLGTTVVFELSGPLLVRFALEKARETEQLPDPTA